MIDATDLTHTVTAFHAEARWTGVRDDDRSAWLAERKKVVTASRVAALLGMSPFEDALDVYVDMLTPLSQDADLGLQDPRTWGKALERAVAETAAKHYGWELRMSGALLVSRRYPKLGATLDAEIVENGEPITYEGKTTSAWRWRDWDEETGQAPDHVIIQAQTQLIVTGAPRGYVCCLIGGNKFSRISVEPLADFRSLIVEAVDEFMEQVAKMDPPPPTFRSRNAIERLYPEDDGGAVKLPAEAVEWTREIQELDAQRKALDVRDAQLRNMLRLAIGSATYGVLPEPVGGKSCWKNAVEAKGRRVLRAVKGPFQNAPTRPRLVQVSEQTCGEPDINPIRFRWRRHAV